jgi:hypothetical protein
MTQFYSISCPKRNVYISPPCMLQSVHHSLCFDTRPWQYLVTEQVMRHPILCMSTGCHRILAKAKFSTPVQAGFGAHSASYTVDTGAFPGVKRPGRDHHPLASRAEIKEIIELYFTPNVTTLRSLWCQHPVVKHPQCVFFHTPRDQLSIYMK